MAACVGACIVLAVCTGGIDDAVDDTGDLAVCTGGIGDAVDGTGDLAACIVCIDGAMDDVGIDDVDGTGNLADAVDGATKDVISDGKEAP